MNAPADHVQGFQKSFCIQSLETPKFHAALSDSKFYFLSKTIVSIAITYMQQRFGLFLITALYNMRALLLLLLTCCIYFAYVDGLKSSSKIVGPGLSKYQPSDIRSANDGSNSASNLDIRGGNRLYSVLLGENVLMLPCYFFAFWRSILVVQCFASHMTFPISILLI